MRYMCLILIDARVVAQAISARVEQVSPMSRSRSAVVSRPEAVAAVDDVEAFLESQVEEAVVAPVAVPIMGSAEAFKALRDCISKSDRRAQASALFEGRYKSGVFSPEGRELLYPYLGSRKIYPAGCVGVRAKLDFVQSLLPSDEPIVNLLPVDLARLALAAGIELPAALQPEPLKASLMGARSAAPSGDEW